MPATARTMPATERTMPIDGATEPPPAPSFHKVTLDPHPGEPIGLAVLPDGRVLHTTRPGTVWIHQPDGTKSVAAQLPVYSHDEEGLLGIAIDPDFDANRWVYVYYSPPLDTPTDDPATADVDEGDAPLDGLPEDFEPFAGAIRLSRFQLAGDQLDLASEQAILEVPVDRGICCHTAGKIDFDAAGNLYLSTGDDSFPFASDGFAPIDERPGVNPALDAQRSAGNTNDLRGKLLRIHVAADGTYAVPDGNLFAPGLPGTRPEIYAMGLRNPYRFAVNRATGAIYLADYSPDAQASDPARGPVGTGKWLIVRGAANYGWPYCVGHLAYVAYDFETGVSGAPFDCDHPRNQSPRNTGLVDLPPVVDPEVAYSYAGSADFPELGSGGVGPMAGPAYVFDPEKLAGPALARGIRRRAAVLRAHARIHRCLPPRRRRSAGLHRAPPRRGLRQRPPSTWRSVPTARFTCWSTAAAATPSRVPTLSCRASSTDWRRQGNSALGRAQVAGRGRRGGEVDGGHRSAT